MCGTHVRARAHEVALHRNAVKSQPAAKVERPRFHVGARTSVRAFSLSSVGSHCSAHCSGGSSTIWSMRCRRRSATYGGSEPAQPA